jgi:curved DNA-binding protein CbpA
MFKDYYAILDISIDAKPIEIKKAYKTQALKWHPDRNPGVDTTQKMQDINEAYLILNDPQAREKYNHQYKRYQEFKAEEANTRQKQTNEQETKHENEFKSRNEKTEFSSDDDELNKWMANARRQAFELAKQTLEDYKNITIAGLTGAAVGCGTALYGYIVSGIIFTVLIFLARSCNS